MSTVKPCRDRYYEPLFQFKKRLRDRIQQKKREQRLIRPEPNGFYADRAFWEQDPTDRGV